MPNSKRAPDDKQWRQSVTPLKSGARASNRLQPRHVLGDGGRVQYYRTRDGRYAARFFAGNGEQIARVTLEEDKSLDAVIRRVAALSRLFNHPDTIYEME